MNLKQMFQFDRTSSQTFKADDHSNDLNYWQERSPLEKLQAAYYLNASAYGFIDGKEPRLDRTCFSARRHGE